MYCKRGPDSDVFAYENDTDTWTCLNCPFLTPKYPNGDVEERSTECKTLVEFRNHMREHVEAGHKVPAEVFERLLWELDRCISMESKNGDPFMIWQLAPAEWN